MIDVLVVYTAAALTGAGGTTAMNALIQLAINETNQSYINSNITQRVRLVHSEQVAYTETGNLCDGTGNSDLYRLQNPSDGYMDNVHTLRNTYGADVVVLLVENGGSYCGCGFIQAVVSASFENYAFVTVARNCATGYYSFGHEMGHLMGARHDWYVDSTNNSPYTYNHGYVYKQNRWRTIMAYNDDCSNSGYNCTRIQYWSNPLVTYGGVPTGVAEGSPNAADNRKTLNNTACTVANFRQSVAPVTTWTNIPGMTSSAPALAWNPGANKLQMVVQAANDALWASSFNSSGVFNNDWTPIPGATPSAPALAWNSSANKLQMVVRASNDALWASSFNSSGVFNNDWTPIPGATPSAPALAWKSSANKLQMVVRASNDALWASSFNSSGVFNNDWTPIPWATPSAPALAWKSSANKLQMVVRASNDALWASSFNSSGVFNNDWTRISGATPSSPAVAWDASVPELGMAVRASNDTIWFGTFNSTGSFNNNWVTLPGGTASPPGMAYVPSIGYFGIVVRASNDSLWEMLY